ncbi:MAG TPA: DUF6153 family protein [Glaciihabitans sp.]|nr:DUF6153 family protein [Glaciihabitans sp.]
MTVMQLRHHLARPLLLARTLVLLAAVGAIIAGILAMHTLASSPAHADPTHAVIADEAHPEPVAVTVATPQICDALCGPEHSMDVMGCILALLSGVFLAGIAVRRNGGHFSAAIRTLSTTATRPTFFCGPAPPDLHVLSISRV